MGIELAPNVVIAGRFRLNRVIGRGGMGSVWHASHLGLDVPCAVKFIEGQYASAPEAQARFEREAKAAAQLRSPHVVQILDHGVWEGVPYLAMELLEGEDLGQRLARIKRMHPKDVCTVVSQISRALTKAHAMGIVHRDLKPDNIFLVRDDDREIAKVLDFGIAKAQHNAIEGSATKTGAMLGTPYYMSPEQAQGTKTVDHRSDLWSLAVIVYRAVTGVLPFESEALGDLLMRIIVAPLPVPSRVAPDLPQSFDRWWETAANRDPARRFQSAKDLLDGLLVTFGTSQLTDFMDRNELRAVIGHEPAPAYQAGMPHTTPQPGHTPGGPAGTWQVTPQPAYGPPPQPQPFGAPLQSQPHATTGAPLAQSFGNAPPKNKTGVIVGVCAAVVLLGAIAVGGAFAVKGHAKDAAGSPGSATTTATVATGTAAAATGTTTATQATTAVLAPTPEPTRAEVEASAPSTVAPPPRATAAPVPRAAPPRAPATPTAAPAATKKPAVDLGI